MTTKIKIFFDGSGAFLEETVNNFIQDKVVLDIKFSSDPVTIASAEAYFNVLIMYEEKAKQ